MTLEEFAQLLRRRWRLVVSVTMVFALAALTVGFLFNAGYQATARLVVAPTANSAAAGGAVAPQLLSSRGMHTYAELSASLEVAAAVAKELELTESPAQVRERLTATVPTDTYMIDITVAADDGEHAVLLANTVAKHASARVNELFSDRHAGFAVVVAASADPAAVTVPNGLRYLPVALVAGVIFGLAAAVIREILDQRVRDEDDLRKSFGVDPLAQVALMRSREEVPLLDPAAWDGETLESVRRLRTTLQMRQNPPRTVLIAGASGGEGSSTVAALLAQITAAAGAKAMLIECDLREPRMAARLGLKDQPGLADFLRGSATFGEVIVDASPKTRTPTPRRRAPGVDPHAVVLGVVTAGSRSREQAELLSRAKFREFLDSVSPFYDMVIIDGAPVLPYTDSVAVSAAVDATVLVVAAGKTPRHEIDQAITQLASVGTDVAGVVLASHEAKATSATRHAVAGGRRAR